ncbi:MAG: cysteine desulfurase family protein [Pseudomonadota bacterium]
MSARVYLDHNATAPLAPTARAAMLAAMDSVGNPSSVHAEGRAARKLMERARSQVAALVNARPGQVIFTSGATEAARLAWHLLGQRVDGSWAPQVVSAIEHTAVTANMTPGAVVCAQPTSDGTVDAASFADVATSVAAAASPSASEASADSAGAVAALMLANNETGCLQPVSAVAAHLRAARSDLRVQLICDAVQGPGRVPVDFAALGCDALILSAHKFGGPKGVGALVIDVDALQPAVGVIRGDQERRHRGGTENLLGIVGMGAAAQAAQAAVDAGVPEQMAARRDALEEAVIAHGNGARVIGASAGRLANTSCIVMPGLQAEVALARFDLDGIAISSGAACSSGKVSSSHVLAAMGIDADLRNSALRFSLGPNTSDAEIERAVATWKRMVGPRATQHAA